MHEAPKIVDIRGLSIGFRSEGGSWVEVVRDLSFSIRKGSTLGIVGESGCGKSVTALSILRLIPDPPGRITGGRILYQSGGAASAPVELTGLSEREMRAIRGDKISMIFQEPMTSLNPVFTVGDQVGEALRVHLGLSREEARRQAVRLFQQVGIADPERRVDEYPHQLSGGMRQRVMIAMALGCGPDLLIADEPTTALDVTIQAQILDLLAQIQQQLGMSILLITHDLGVVAEMCEEVLVMYAGEIVEQAPAAALLGSPRHPYTAGLLRSRPEHLEEGSGEGEGTPRRRRRLAEIPGMVPRLDALPAGCLFQARCPQAGARCSAEAPALRELPGEPGRLVRCHFPMGEPAAARGARA